MENGKLAHSSELKHNEKSIKVLLKAENCMIRHANSVSNIF